MGSQASRPCHHLIITLDALGTIYRFKEPVAVQYTKVAQQCGLRSKVDVKALDESFRHAFKQHNRDFPNYGKGKMDSPEVWWDSLIQASFKPLVDNEPLPPDLGRHLYNHFSTASAYELFPDLTPFLETIRLLRERYSDPFGPIVSIGVITNSDPRVREVLRSLRLKVGNPEYSPKLSYVVRTNNANLKTFLEGTEPLKSHMYEMYDSQNAIDFLVTSYEVGFEKPSQKIFDYGRDFAFCMPMSRYERWVSSQQLEQWERLRRDFETGRQFLRWKARWIHVGDDFEKDYEGAWNAGLEALWLARGLKDEKAKGDLPKETVASLADAAEVIRLIANQEFGTMQKA